MPMKKDLQLTELPLNARFKRKPRTPNVKAIRQKAKITVAYFDAAHYGGTLKRGITIVKGRYIRIGIDTPPEMAIHRGEATKMDRASRTASRAKLSGRA